MAPSAPAVRYGAISESAPPAPARRKAERLGTVVAFTALLGASASLSFRPLMSAAGARLAVTEAGATGAASSTNPAFAANSTDGPSAADSTDAPSASNSTDAALATDTIDVYYVESKEEMSWYAYHFLDTFVFPLVGRQMRVRTFGSVKQLLASAVSDSSVLRAGSIVIFGSRAEIVTRNRTIGNDTRSISNYTIDDSRSVDPYCAYQFSNADPLLAAPSVQALLAWRRPLVLVDSNDWSCRVDYPPTIHQVWRNAYGSDVMANAAFLPMGPSYTDANFLANASVSSATPISARGFGLAWMGSLTERKTVRVHFHHLMSGGMKNRLTEIARDAGLDGIVYDMTRAGPHNVTPYTYEAQWNASFFHVLTHTRLYACLAGDVWADTNLWNVLEFGVIPVVERRASFKGCRDPTGWLERSSAPVLWVDEWSELPKVLADALSNDTALEQRRQELVRWWAAAKREFGQNMIAFHERWRDASESAYPPNDCTSVALTDAQEQAYQNELDAYYDQEHWFENFPGSPWLAGIWCWKRATENWYGLQCYSPKCAEPAVASFTCSNTTITARNF